MTAVHSKLATPQIKEQLRDALRHTRRDMPRPVADLDLPFSIDRFIAPKVVGNLTPAGVLMAILNRPGGPTVLLTERASHLRKHGGQVSFPGGKQEEGDDDVVYTALREAQEEIGLPMESCEIIGYLDDYPTVTGFRVTPAVAWVERPPRQFILDPGEVAAAFEVPLTFFLQESSYARKVFTKNGLNIPFFELNHSGHRIWGATAGMLKNFYQLMADCRSKN